MWRGGKGKAHTNGVFLLKVTFVAAHPGQKKEYFLHLERLGKIFYKNADRILGITM